jgi:hypothetical protein
MGTSSHPRVLSLLPPSCLQLAWACEAFILDSEGAPDPVQSSVLEVLEKANIT